MNAPASSYPSLSPIGAMWRSPVVELIYLLVSIARASIGAFIGTLSNSTASSDRAVIMLSMLTGGMPLGYYGLRSSRLFLHLEESGTDWRMQ